MRDTGIGIPEDKIGQIFEEFAQADASVTRKYGGTGLGLTISHRLAELMGGRLEVSSVQGKGSTSRAESLVAGKAQPPREASFDRVAAEEVGEDPRSARNAGGELPEES